MENYYYSVVLKVPVSKLIEKEKEKKLSDNLGNFDAEKVDIAGAHNWPMTCNPWVIPKLEKLGIWPVGHPNDFKRSFVWRQGVADAADNIKCTYLGLNFPTFAEYKNWLTSENASLLIGLAVEMHINKILDFTDPRPS